jgi:hypothetical protein
VGDLNTLMDHCTRRMRAAGMEGFIPTIGEEYGMENALMLVICQDPDNPGVKRSGELSFTNNAPSANMLRESFKYLYLDWGITVPWNAILWSQMGEKDHDLGIPPLARTRLPYATLASPILSSSNSAGLL